MRVVVSVAIASVLVALSSGGHAAPALSVSQYRASLNAMCRRTTVKLHAIESQIGNARKIGDTQAYAVALGEYLGLGLREDKTLETTPVPAPLRTAMAPALRILRRIDADVNGAIASMAAGNGAAAQASLATVAVVSRPLNGYLDRAGLRDCGSNQS